MKKLLLLIGLGLILIGLSAASAGTIDGSSVGAAVGNGIWEFFQFVLGLFGGFGNGDSAPVG